MTSENTVCVLGVLLAFPVLIQLVNMYNVPERASEAPAFREECPFSDDMLLAIGDMEKR
jgi:hypothetical protein